MAENRLIIENREKTKHQRNYIMLFKLGLVSRIEIGEFTYKQTQQHYGTQGKVTFGAAREKYGNLNWSKPTIHTISQSRKTLV